MTDVWKAWLVDFGPIEGRRGERKTLSSTPVVKGISTFRPETLFVTDPSEVSVCSISVAGKVQRLISVLGRPPSDRLKVSTFLADLSGYDECGGGQEIKFEIEFLKDVSFQATMFGKACVDA